jgi:nucleoside phosphorylase
LDFPPLFAHLPEGTSLPMLTPPPPPAARPAHLSHTVDTVHTADTAHTADTVHTSDTADTAHADVAICGSGDSFATGTPPLACDVIDMEAYALAKVCHVEGARFACVKYVTDGADETAAVEWQDNLTAAADAFWQLYQAMTSGR